MDSITKNWLRKLPFRLLNKKFTGVDLANMWIKETGRKLFDLVKATMVVDRWAHKYFNVDNIDSIEYFHWTTFMGGLKSCMPEGYEFKILNPYDERGRAPLDKLAIYTIVLRNLPHVDMYDRVDDKRIVWPTDQDRIKANRRPKFDPHKLLNLHKLPPGSAVN